MCKLPISTDCHNSRAPVSETIKLYSEMTSAYMVVKIRTEQNSKRELGVAAHASNPRTQKASLVYLVRS